MIDVEKMAKAVFASVQEYVGKALLPITERLKALEDRPQIPGEKGEKGIDGKDGKDGKDGASPAPEAVAAVLDIQGLIDSAIDRIPAARDGKDGIDGKDGVSPTPEEVAAALNTHVSEWALDFDQRAQDLIQRSVDRISPPKDGKDGVDGKNGVSPSPEDVAAALDIHVSKWALDFERRAQDLIQRVIDRIPAPKDGKDGVDGKDGIGVDGLGFEDLSLDYDGERNVKINFTKGDQVKSFDLSLPIVLDRGVYQNEKTYTTGDGVTCGGCFWIAQRNTDIGRPGTPDSGWRLAVKKGRDGKGV
jgi:integrin beta 3